MIWYVVKILWYLSYQPPIFAGMRVLFFIILYRPFRPVRKFYSHTGYLFIGRYDDGWSKKCQIPEFTYRPASMRGSAILYQGIPSGLVVTAEDSYREVLCLIPARECNISQAWSFDWEICDRMRSTGFFLTWPNVSWPREFLNDWELFFYMICIYEQAIFLSVET